MKYYEIKLNQKEHKRFCTVMHKRLDEQNKTLKDLAEALNVSIQSIYNFEKDTSRNPSRFLAGKIATELDIAPREYRGTGGAFLIFAMGIGLALILVPEKAEAENYIDYSKYIVTENKDTYTEVFGEDNGSDFVPGYYDSIIDEDLPLEPEVQMQIKEICERKHISYELVLAIMEKESHYNADAQNGSCKGVMQLNTNYHDINNPFDVIENVEVGTDYLLFLFEQNEDVAWVLDTYNGRNADYNQAHGIISSYAKEILERSEELERSHNK